MDIVISALFLAFLFSSFENFLNLFIFFLLYLTIKIAVLRILAKKLYLNNVDLKFCDEESLEALKTFLEISKHHFWEKSILVILVYTFLAFPQLLSILIYLLSFGTIFIPFYGKLKIEIGFSEVKGGARKTKEINDICILSILFEAISSIVLSIFLPSYSKYPILMGIGLLIPYISTEGFILFSRKRNYWLLSLISFLLAFFLPFSLSISSLIFFSILTLLMLFFEYLP